MSNKFTLKECADLVKFMQENGINIVPINETTETKGDNICITKTFATLTTPSDKKGTLICEKITTKSLIKKYTNQLKLGHKDILNVKCPEEIKVRKQVE